MNEQTPAEQLLADAAERAQRVVDKADVVAEALVRATETNKVDLKRSVDESVASALRDIFTEASEENPEHMQIIHSKLPILCVRVDIMDTNIQEIRDIIKESVGPDGTYTKQLNWTTRMVWLAMGGVSVVALIIVPIFLSLVSGARM